jgi:hypothetical protein
MMESITSSNATFTLTNAGAFIISSGVPIMDSAEKSQAPCFRTRGAKRYACTKAVKSSKIASIELE